ncbi:uncharacterized protein IWZ02DRAFT_41343 [Phyllosticta citriasiana]|uniref:Uncharacterized protein n=1 Tax=Phyllosticta citriasiana TaxID=595635 RepID=A0ABR1KC48_9PEZI
MDTDQLPPVMMPSFQEQGQPAFTPAASTNIAPPNQNQHQSRNVQSIHQSLRESRRLQRGVLVGHRARTPPQPRRVEVPYAYGTVPLYAREGVPMYSTGVWRDQHLRLTRGQEQRSTRSAPTRIYPSRGQDPELPPAAPERTAEEARAMWTVEQVRRNHPYQTFRDFPELYFGPEEPPSPDTLANGLGYYDNTHDEPSAQDQAPNDRPPSPPFVPWPQHIFRKGPRGSSCSSVGWGKMLARVQENDKKWGKQRRRRSSEVSPLTASGTAGGGATPANRSPSPRPSFVPFINSLSVSSESAGVSWKNPFPDGQDGQGPEIDHFNQGHHLDLEEGPGYIDDDDPGEGPSGTQPRWAEDDPGEGPSGTQPTWAQDGPGEGPSGTQPSWAQNDPGEGPSGTQPSWAQDDPGEGPSGTQPRSAQDEPVEQATNRRQGQYFDENENGEGPSGTQPRWEYGRQSEDPDEVRKILRKGKEPEEQHPQPWPLPNPEPPRRDENRQDPNSERLQRTRPPRTQSEPPASSRVDGADRSRSGALRRRESRASLRSPSSPSDGQSPTARQRPSRFRRFMQRFRGEHRIQLSASAGRHTPSPPRRGPQLCLRRREIGRRLMQTVGRDIRQSWNRRGRRQSLDQHQRPLAPIPPEGTPHEEYRGTALSPIPERSDERLSRVLNASYDYLGDHPALRPGGAFGSNPRRQPAVQPAASGAGRPERQPAAGHARQSSNSRIPAPSATTRASSLPRPSRIPMPVSQSPLASPVGSTRRVGSHAGFQRPSAPASHAGSTGRTTRPAASAPSIPQPAGNQQSSVPGSSSAQNVAPPSPGVGPSRPRGRSQPSDSSGLSKSKGKGRGGDHSHRPLGLEMALFPSRYFNAPWNLVDPQLALLRGPLGAENGRHARSSRAEQTRSRR